MPGLQPLTSDCKSFSLGSSQEPCFSLCLLTDISNFLDRVILRPVDSSLTRFPLSPPASSIQYWSPSSHRTHPCPAHAHPQSPSSCQKYTNQRPTGVPAPRANTDPVNPPLSAAAQAHAYPCTASGNRDRARLLPCPALSSRFLQVLRDPGSPRRSL